MAEPATHCLPVAQPWAWALIQGKLQVANLDLPPPNVHVGTRIAIEATEFDLFFPWLFRTTMKIEIDESAAWRTGMVGTAELEGWVRVEGGKVVETYRPGTETPFRKLRGLHGRFGWVLRKPRLEAGAARNLKVFRARIEDAASYRQDLLSYAKAHGTDGLNSAHLKILDGLGYRAVMGKGNENG